MDESKITTFNNHAYCLLSFFDFLKKEENFDLFCWLTFVKQYLEIVETNKKVFGINQIFKMIFFKDQNHNTRI